MKKVISVVIVLFCMGVLQPVSAQEIDVRDIDSFSFYGVDFSRARVYGAQEAFGSFVEAFIGINHLFESEPKKYRADRAFGVRHAELFNKQLKRDAEDISRKELFTDDNRYQLTDADIAEVVKRIEKKGDDQYGAVIVCGLLDKMANYGTFTFVVFDQNSKEIVFQREVAGKAGGMGLRNFWAGSLLRAMKNLNYMIN